MTRQGKHPANCAKATAARCACTHCAGTQHGWVGAFDFVRYQTREELDELKRRVDDRSRQEREQHAAKDPKRRKVTLDYQQAVVNSARIDLIERLREQVETVAPPDEFAASPHVPKRSGVLATPAQPDEPNHYEQVFRTASVEADRVDALGNLLGQVFTGVEHDVGELKDTTRRAMAEHFWCELLVQVIIAVEGSSRQLNSLHRTITNRILESHGAARLGKLERRVVTACVKQLCNRLAEATGMGVVSDAKTLLPAVRTLAVLLCKSPPRHHGVITHCVDPLKASLLRGTKEHLRDVFSDELVPEITSDCDGTEPTASTAQTDEVRSVA